MRGAALLLLVLLPTGGLQAEPFAAFQAFIGPELEDRTHYRALYVCGQQPSCDPSYLPEGLISKHATQIGCGAEQIERCMDGIRKEVCLRDSPDLLRGIRQDIIDERDADRLQAAAQHLSPFRRELFLRRSVGFGSGPELQAQKFECLNQDVAVQKGMDIPDNLFCYASRALSFWTTADGTRSEVEHLEEESR